MEICKCTKEAEIATMQTEIKTIFKLTEKNKSDIKDLNKIYELIRDLTVSVSVLAEQMKTNTKDIGDIKKDVEQIRSKPAEDFFHYKRLVAGGLLTTLIGGILGAILATILR